VTARLQRAATIALIVLFALAGIGAPALLIVGAQRGDAALADTEGLGLMRLSSATVDIVAGERGTSITATNLAPGDRVVGSIEVRNAGTMALHWSLVTEGNADPLATWLRWDLWLAAAPSACTASPNGPARFDQWLGSDLDLSGAGQLITLSGDPLPGADPTDRVLRAGASEAVCLAVVLPLEVPDTVQSLVTRQPFTLVAEGNNAGEAIKVTDGGRPAEPAATVAGASTAATAAPSEAAPVGTSAGSGSVPGTVRESSSAGTGGDR
jgi:hypothetical protein